MWIMIWCTSGCKNEFFISMQYLTQFYSEILFFIRNTDFSGLNLKVKMVIFPDKPITSLFPVLSTVMWKIWIILVCFAVCSLVTLIEQRKIMCRRLTSISLWRRPLRCLCPSSSTSLSLLSLLKDFMEETLHKW